jgi:hypothetical protein
MGKANCVCHIQIPAPDMNKAREFYGKVFGWEITVLPGGTYAFFKDGGEGGALSSESKPSDDGVRLFISVDDIPSKLKEIAAAGGEELTPKTKISDEHGYFAFFRDTNRGKMGLWSQT